MNEKVVRLLKLKNLWLLAAIVIVCAVVVEATSMYGSAVTRSNYEVPSSQTTGQLLTKSFPTRLRIPNLKLNTGFVEPLGLTSTNEIEVPESYGDVGWYKFGPTPGELGPAVILGHVDSVDGPAVFWSLGQLKEGDDIFVDREDGTTVQFKVTELRRVAQTDFPTQDVYGDIDHVGLRLITCTGIYNHGEQRYSHNLIVFARAV